jgi:hypothetical protein
MITHRTPAQIPEMDAIHRCDTLRELPTRVPSNEFLEMQQEPGRLFVMLFWAAVSGVVLWALLVALFSVVTP